ncbi:hypothetical protein FFI97_025260 [Variovorax sp. KBS0712]|uniref:hypothetical protein n=1 Tax=Variovorax sp. KBS0712 TaxID=2578111 RepID=UPI00111953C1|nr:hypothetical protein [Variovorax sp. KBS0712]TSD54686.1 hypothetical protein FFI97_025260 [Variovorax sp. KBS0712]
MKELTRATLVFTAEITVYDEEALRRAALARAQEDGLSELEWAAIRQNPGQSQGQAVAHDLVMLLDPGLIDGAGFEILHSQCEAVEP